MSLDQDIRGALENRLLGVSGLPTNIAHQGELFRPPAFDIPWVVTSLVPVRERPSTLGDAHLVLHEGLFMVVLVFPAGDGTGAIDVLSNAVKARFRANDSAVQNSVIVRFRYAEKKSYMQDADWIRLPIEIGWYLFDTGY